MEKVRARAELGGMICVAPLPPPLLCPLYILPEEVQCEQGSRCWLKPMHTGSTTVIIWTIKGFRTLWFSKYLLNESEGQEMSGFSMCLIPGIVPSLLFACPGGGSESLAMIKWRPDFMIEFVPCS